MEEYPMSRVRASDQEMEDYPTRSEENSVWIKSPNAPDFPAPVWWPLDGTYNLFGEPNPKV